MRELVSEWDKKGLINSEREREWKQKKKKMFDLGANNFNVVWDGFDVNHSVRSESLSKRSPTTNDDRDVRDDDDDDEDEDDDDEEEEDEESQRQDGYMVWRLIIRLLGGFNYDHWHNITQYIPAPTILCNTRSIFLMFFFNIEKKDNDLLIDKNLDTFYWPYKT